MTVHDDAGFRDFVEARWASLVGTAYLVVGDRGRAEDCVQQALARTHGRWRALQRDGVDEADARRAVINAALSWRRRRRVADVPLTAGYEPPGTPGVHDHLDVDLIRNLRALPPRMRCVVVLRYVEDRSEAETADLLDCSMGTVKRAGHRGLARLRRQLGSDPVLANPAGGGDAA